MIKEAIGEAATVEEATQKAKDQLGAGEENDLKIEILEMPVKKTLGLFGGSPAKVRVYFEESPYAVAEDYVASILKGMGLENVTIETTEGEEDIFMQINCGEDYGFVIGRRGETLDAIQYLTRLVLNRESTGFKRVSLNVGSYREKREQTLKELAQRTAEKAKKFKRSFALDPMNPYERRIVHTAVQEIEGVESHSVGLDSERRVVVAPVGYSRGGKGDGKGGYQGKRSDTRQAPRTDKPQAQPAQKEKAPQSAAVASTPRYGKITPNK